MCLDILVHELHLVPLLLNIQITIPFVDVHSIQNPNTITLKTAESPMNV